MICTFPLWAYVLFNWLSFLMLFAVVNLGRIIMQFKIAKFVFAIFFMLIALYIITKYISEDPDKKKNELEESLLEKEETDENVSESSSESPEKDQ
jgi:predicted membrane protein